MDSQPLPLEVVEFERLLNQPADDPAGLSGFFGDGEIVVARAPARLDIMGGIADYSGANVCEGTLGQGVLVALQLRTDPTLCLRSQGTGHRSLPVETRIPLECFQTPKRHADYDDVRELFRTNPLLSWGAYIGGSIFTLLKQEGIRLSQGFSLLVLSAVPMNVGIGSSAAVEMGTLACLDAHLGLKLDGERLSNLGQMAENRVVGAPCGIMDQTAITCGRQGRLTHILCRPGKVMGEVSIPEETGFVGISSMVRHSVAGNPYGDTRIGAFMGKRIINVTREKSGKEPIGFLTELTPNEFRSAYENDLPESLLGSEFLELYKTHDDPVTTIRPEATYRVAGPTRHPIVENARVLAFMNHLKDLADAPHRGEADLIAAGELMYDAHESYRLNCNLSVGEVDFLVEAVRKRGASKGLYGAKITGGGTGGTVAVFGRLDALRREIPAIAEEYSRRIGRMPDIFEGTSPGTVEFGTRRYRFGANGWEGIKG